MKRDKWEEKKPRKKKMRGSTTPRVKVKEKLKNMDFSNWEEFSNDSFTHTEKDTDGTRNDRE